MNIGILSLKYQNNYGGILQSFALQEYLKSLNHEVEIINFKLHTKEGFFHRFIYLFFNTLFSRNIITTISDKFKEKKKRKGVDSYELINNNEQFMLKFLNRSRPIDENDISSYCVKFDCIIIGSDQVWSVTNSKHLIYFFDWNFKGSKIAFSACSVYNKPAFLNKRKIKKLLYNFNAITVRDETTKSFVHSVLHIEPRITIDPTLLIDFESSLPIRRLISEPYMFVYILGDEIEGGNKQAIKLIKAKYGNIKVISIVVPSISLAGYEGADTVLTQCTPIEWICLLKYSEFVFTDSFHGCIFSLKYHKHFIGYYKYAKRASRLIDLKKRYKLTNILTNCKEISNDKFSDTASNYNRIKADIEFSCNFLKTIR